MKRWFNNRDDNEPELKFYAEAIGLNVFEGGPLDLWTPWLHGAFLPIEVKNPKGRNRYQPSQIEFMALCDALGWQYATWRTTDDVQATQTRLRALQALADRDRAQRAPVRLLRPESPPEPPEAA